MMERCGDNCIYGTLRYKTVDGLPKECDCCKWEYWGSEGSTDEYGNYWNRDRYIGVKKNFKEKVMERTIDTIEELNDDEKQVLELRWFGGLDDVPKTYKEVEELTGICKNRVRQMEAKALRKLRRTDKCLSDE